MYEYDDKVFIFTRTENSTFVPYGWSMQNVVTYVFVVDLVSEIQRGARAEIAEDGNAEDQLPSKRSSH